MDSSSRQKRNRSCNKDQLMAQGDEVGNEDRLRISQLCNPQLRDPLTITISFMPNPSHFRQCCRFTVEVWDQAVYLEGDLPCPSATSSSHSDGEVDSDNSVLQEGGSRRSRTHTAPIFMSKIHRGQSDFLENQNIDSVSVSGIPDFTTGSQRQNFLCNRSSLKEIRVQNLPVVTSMGRFALSQCDSLESVTFENLPELESLGENFLSHSRSLTSLRFEDFPSLTKIGGNFLTACEESLRSVTFSKLPRLHTIKFGFLARCAALTKIEIQDFPELFEIGNLCLYCCSALESATFKSLPKLTSIGTDFLSNADFLTHFSLENLPELASVDNRWLFHCFRLESFTLKQLPKLRTIGSHFLGQCVSLETATFNCLPVLENVKQDGWMQDCPMLSEVFFDEVPNLVMGSQWNPLQVPGWWTEASQVVVTMSCHKTLQDVATKKQTTK